MAAYTQRLLEPLQLRLAEQAEEIGRLRAELRHAQASGQERAAQEVGHLTAELERARQQVAAFEAATDELEREQQAAAAEVARRPWWRFWG